MEFYFWKIKIILSRKNKKVNAVQIIDKTL